MSLRDHLNAIFRADREIRDAEAKLLAAGDPSEIEEALGTAVEEAKRLDDRREALMRLERLADLCAQVPGPRMADALITILDDDDPGVRVAAGEALADIGYERYAEVARGVERALQRGAHGPAMRELPWILAEIGEPSALPLIRKFLESTDPEVVASGIEALAELGDAGAVQYLTPLTKDARSVTLDDHDSEVTVTLGQLASEAIEELSG